VVTDLIRAVEPIELGLNVNATPSQIDAARSELSRLLRDAERYRWLREHQDCIPDLSSCRTKENQKVTLDAFLDVEINGDAKREEEGGW
jgi:hypothetical protein